MLGRILLVISIVTFRACMANPINENSLNDNQTSIKSENHHNNAVVKTRNDAIKFLNQFGYNPCENPTDSELSDSERPSCQVSIEDMLESFQLKYHLPVTKTLDVPTLKLMNSPRCGVSDYVAAMVDYRSIWPKNRVLKWKLKLDNLPITSGEIRQALTQAFNDWSGPSGLTFTEVHESDIADFNISFVIGEHGDGFPINEPTSILAHAFYPWDSRYRGNIHFNMAKDWSNKYDGFGYNLRLVATHEIGHSLGLEHTYDLDSIMQSIYQTILPENILPRPDKHQIRTLYNNYESSSTTQVYDKEPNDDPATNSVIFYPDRSRYDGDLKNGIHHGKGTFYWANGNKYVGDWVEGEITGQGIYTWLNGTRYEGNWKNGRRYGHGTLYGSNERTCVGNWINNAMDGYGSCTGPKKDRYEGYWKDGKRNGQGTYHSDDGKIYQGYWINGKLNGHGTLTWPNHDRYDGNWKDDRRNGYGIMNYADGRKYQGNWFNGKMHGFGIYTWLNHDRYDGHWKDNKRNGYGIMNFADGRIYQGNWTNDRMNRHGVLIWTNHDRYDGEWKDNARHGYGIMDFADGRKYEGYWFKDTIKGYGVYRWPTGDRYEGYWVNNERNGNGTHYFADGRIYQGIWINDILNNSPSRTTTIINDQFDEDITKDTKSKQNTFNSIDEGKNHNGEDMKVEQTTEVQQTYEKPRRRSLWIRLKEKLRDVILS